MDICPTISISASGTEICIIFGIHNILKRFFDVLNSGIILNLVQEMNKTIKQKRVQETS